MRISPSPTIVLNHSIIERCDEIAEKTRQAETPNEIARLSGDVLEMVKDILPICPGNSVDKLNARIAILKWHQARNRGELTDQKTINKLKALLFQISCDMKEALLNSDFLKSTAN